MLEVLIWFSAGLLLVGLCAAVVTVSHPPKADAPEDPVS